MTLLRAEFLYALLLGAPIAVLYFLRTRRRRAVVSSLMFWDEVLREERTAALLGNLRKLLSLLVQLVMLALLGFAMARPILTGRKAARTRHILLVDVSASMRAVHGVQSRIEEAKRAVTQRVGALGPDDEMMIVAVADGPRILCSFTNDRKTLQHAARQLGPTDLPTDFKEAFRLAIDIPSTDFRKAVCVIGDGNFAAPDCVIPEDVDLHYVPIGRSVENAAITAFQARALPMSPQDYEILARVQWSGRDELRATLELSVDDELLDVRPVVIPANGARSETFSSIRVTGRRIRAHLRTDDALSLDNDAYALLPAIEPIRVLLVSKGNPFLEAALISDDAAQVDRIAPDSYVGGSDYDVAVFDRWEPRGLGSGRFMLVGVRGASLAFTAQQDIQDAVVTEWDGEHRLLRGVQLRGVRVPLLLGMRAGAAGSVVVKSADAAVIVCGKRDGGRFVLMPFDAREGDLPLRVAFPLLISNALRYLTGRASAQFFRAAKTGETWKPQGVSASSRVRTPSGRELDAAKGAVTLAECGLYKSVGVQESEALVAASLCDERESNLRVVRRLDVAGRTADRPPQGRRVRASMWQWLALAALALSGLEWFLFHRRILE